MRSHDRHDRMVPTACPADPRGSFRLVLLTVPALLCAGALCSSAGATPTAEGTPGSVGPSPLQDPPPETDPPETDPPEDVQEEVEEQAGEEGDPDAAEEPPAEEAVEALEEAEVPPPTDPLAADQASLEQSPEEGASLSGFITARYRSRWTGEEDDQDLYAVGAIDILTGGKDPWGIHVMGRGAWDMDGRDSASTFYHVDDSYDSSVTGRLYHAYFDAPVASMDAVRVGRQVIFDTPVRAYFDGALLETAEFFDLGLQVGAYGGVSTHLFESSPSGDFTGGAYTSLRPWYGGKLRFDYMHLQDEAQLGTNKDDLLQLGFRQHFDRVVQLEGDYSWLEGERRDVDLRGNWFYTEQEFSLQLSYYELFQEQGQLSLELNPFYNSLQTMFPYRQTRIQLTKAFSEWVDIFGGVDLRRVDDEGDIGKFNRDFDRYYLTLVLGEGLPLDSSIGFRGEMWDSPSNDINTWGLDLTSELGKGFQSALGTYYSLYKYYLDINLEREDVRTYYAELRKALFDDATDWMVRYEYEDTDFDYYHTLRLGMTWRF